MKKMRTAREFKVFDQEDFILIEDNCFNILEKIEKHSIDMVFADPPYFLSGGGVTCSNGKMVSVNKAVWDEEISASDKLNFNRKWIGLCRDILKENGTIWISGTLHNIYSIGMALELEGFDIINNVTWEKPNPPPNLGCRAFTHSTETLLWARKKFDNNKKGKHTFNYLLMKEINDNKQMKDVWSFVSATKKEKTEGKHPTQKPLLLLERVILSSTNEGDVVLDPFSGSGTTGIACIRHKRNYIGIEMNPEYNEIAIKRYFLEKDDKDNG
ncbi:site-specific DNA-methyltransferase [Erysipelothrix rhusiopathiae]|nr:site-specific DNA-methyltransferase [Erysipelothrix rhusiopathiae]MDE9421730.1 site-specific DNA-methyltransferase [Erysipelothrix rhusiopathiae]